MQQNIRTKLTKFAAIGLSSAMLLVSTPLTFADAAETQNPVVVNKQEAANQALQAYLADSNGLFIPKATAETVNLPFSSELYYGHSLLGSESQKAWDIVVRELLAFDSNKKYDGAITLKVLDNGVGRLTFDFQKLGINAPVSEVKHFNTYLKNSEARMFHLNGQSTMSDAEKVNVTTLSFDIQAHYTKPGQYQKTLLNMEKRTSELLSVVDERMTDAQKVAALYNKFRTSTKYVKNSGHWIMTGPLLEGGGICGGYSWAFQYLLQRAGIEAIYATGGTSLGYHAWNYMELDGKWYFADSTWGGNQWLLKGESSLTSHKRYSPMPMPELAKADYDLSKTVFNVAEENVKDVVEVVKEVLSDKSVKLNNIRAIVAGNPVNKEYSGTTAETAVKNKLEQAFANIDGTFEIVIHNSTGSKTATDVVAKDLTVTYKLDNGKETYTYKNGKITKK